MNNSKLFRIFFGSIASLVLFFAFSFNLFSQEIPNGDGDLLWERSIYPRFVNDAKFHPINGNIIAAVNHEIWEIDPKDGHTIRIFEGGTGTGEYDQFEGLQITSDGKTIVTDGGSGIEGLLIWDYETGKIKKVFDKGGPNRGSLGIFPDNKRAIFFTFKLEGSTDRQIVIYNFETDKIEKQISIAPYGAEKLSLSKDGKYLAIGKTYNDNGNWTMNMELWDAETLTKIKDFGEAKVGDFKDIQISNDNNYIGFLGISRMYLINQEYKSEHIYEGGKGFTFSNDNKKILITSDTSIFNPEVNLVTYFYNLINNDSLYQYTNIHPQNYRINKENQLLAGNYILQLYSDHWFNVHVQEKKVENLEIIYFNTILSILLPQGIISKQILITDTTGKLLLKKDLIINNNLLTLKLQLPSGVYFLKLITSTGQEITQKFIVVE